MLGIYIPLMIVIFICLGVCIVIIYVSESQQLRDKITENIDYYDPDSRSSRNKAATKAVDAVQKSASGFVCSCSTKITTRVTPTAIHH